MNGVKYAEQIRREFPWTAHRPELLDMIIAFDDLRAAEAVIFTTSMDEDPDSYARAAGAHHGASGRFFAALVALGVLPFEERARRMRAFRGAPRH